MFLVSRGAGGRGAGGARQCFARTMMGNIKFFMFHDIVAKCVNY